MASAKSIKESLIEQLIKKDANIEHFSSLIDDYIWYWKEEKAMQKDIKDRGRTYKAISAAGKEYEKDNNFGIYVCRAGIDIVQRFLG